MSGSIILQRRSSKIEVQLASFATFSAFEEHVGSKFEIDQGVRERGEQREACLCQGSDASSTAAACFLYERTM